MLSKENFNALDVRTRENNTTHVKLMDFYFSGILLSTFFAALNRKLDLGILDLVIGLLFPLICVLGAFILSQRMFQEKASKLTQGTLILGLVTNLLIAISLGIVKILSFFRDLTWNVDSRLFLSQTYSYLRFGNSNNSNSYSGFDIQYHASPSYIAAQVFDLFKINPSITLFIAVPLITLVALYLSSESILRVSGLSRTGANLGALFVLSTSYVTAFSQRSKLLTPLINSELMLNAQLAVSVVLATVYIQIRELPGKHFFLFASLISLVGLKPQYIPFAILSYMLVAASRADLVGLRNTLKKCLHMVISSILAIPLVLFLSKSEFGPEYTARLIPIDWTKFLRDNALLVIAAVFLPLIAKLPNREKFSWSLRFLSLMTAIYLACSLALELILFQPSRQILNKMQIFKPTKAVGDSDFNQGLLLIFILITISSISLIWKIISESSIKTICVTLILLSILRLFCAVPEFVYPISEGYEAVNLNQLRQTLIQAEKRIPNPKLMVNDFVDPAENYRRNGSGMYWSSIGIGHFYLSDVNTFHYLAPDITQRLEKTKIFFNSPISSFHSNFLQKNNIDFVIINLRCTPNWFSEMRPVHLNGSYALLETKFFHNRTSRASDLKQTLTQSRNFGLSRCL
jgi:hypothetical protein